MLPLLLSSLAALTPHAASPQPASAHEKTAARLTASRALPLLASSTPPRSPPLPLPLVLAAGIACQGALQHGIATAALNVPQAAMTSSLGISLSSPSWSAAVSAFCVGGLFGANAASSVADARGRKLLLCLSAVICVVGGMLQVSSGLLGGRAGQAVLALVGGRLVTGFGCGLATVGVPLYLGEIAPSRLRGAFGALNQLSICAGILLTQAFSAFVEKYTTMHWRVSIGLPILVGLVQLVGLAFVPESPRWQLAKQREQQAARSLRSLRSSDEEVEADMGELKRDLESSDSDAGTEYGIAKLFSTPSLKLPLAIAFSMMIGQQWSGINAVFFYSTSFFAAAGLSNPVLATLLASALNLLAMLLAVPLMERVGRKRLLQLGAKGMLASGLLLCSVLSAKALSAPFAPMLNSLSVLAVLLYVCAFEVGPGPIPWQIGSEIFPEAPRASAMSLAAALNWGCNAAIGLGFPSLQRALGPLSFLPFCAVLTGWIAFTAKYVPETRGKSLSQIQEELAAISSGGPPAE